MTNNRRLLHSRSDAFCANRRLWWIGVGLLAGWAIGGCRPADPTSQPAIVVGGSMAPNLLGEHAEASCPDCGAVLRCDMEQAAERQTLVCGNCGFDQIDAQQRQTRPAEIMHVDAHADLTRWSIVAFSRPDGKLGVKRIVGLPGDFLEFRDGNLWRRSAEEPSWRPLLRTIDQQREMAIGVHDNQWRPSTPLWKAAEASGWSQIDEGWVWQPTGDDAANSPDDWLSFRPRRGYATKLKAPPESIEDSYAYNQNLPRDLHPVDELLWRVAIRADAECQLAMRTQQRGGAIEIRWQPTTGELTVTGVAGDAQPFQAPVVPAGQKASLLASTFDGHLSLQIGPWQLGPIPLAKGKPVDFTSPLSLSASGGNVVVERIQLWRDVYYFQQSAGGGQPRPLAAGNGWLLLGDNQPLSLDCRHWNPPALPTEAILGRLSGAAQRPDFESQQR